MSDIVERLRFAADDTDAVENASVAYLLEEAAAEIKRLRGSTVEQRFCEPPVAGSTPAAGFLTDAEREAVAAAIDFCERTDRPLPRSEQLVTLRGLLARCATGHQ